jgi:hypothetical protein
MASSARPLEVTHLAFFSHCSGLGPHLNTVSHSSLQGHPAANDKLAQGPASIPILNSQFFLSFALHSSSLEIASTAPPLPRVSAGSMRQCDKRNVCRFQFNLRSKKPLASALSSRAHEEANTAKTFGREKCTPVVMTGISFSPFGWRDDWAKVGEGQVSARILSAAPDLGAAPNSQRKSNAFPQRS